MSLFTFYLYRPDGSSIAFETFELMGDDQAFSRARKVLVEHASSVQVEIWTGERLVGVVDHPSRSLETPRTAPTAGPSGAALSA